MPSAYDIWGVISSVIGLLSIFQVLAAIVRAQLPTSRLRKFDHLRQETHQLLQSVTEEGLFQDGGRYIQSNQARIAKVCNRLEALRAQAFMATTYKDELRQWWSGLSAKISLCCADLTNIRVHISTTSSEAREARARHQKEQADASATGPASADVLADPATVASPEAPIDEGLCVLNVDKSSLSGAVDGIQQPEYISKGDSDSFAPIAPIAAQDVVGDVTDATCCPKGQQVPPPYRRNTIPPPYQSSSSPSQGGANIIRTAAVLARYTASRGHAARVNHKLVQAHRRSLMLHNVPWKDGCTPGEHPGLRSAASVCRDLNRPSVSPKAWNALRKTRGVLSMYVTVLSADEPVLPTSSDVGR